MPFKGPWSNREEEHSQSPIIERDSLIQVDKKDELPLKFKESEVDKVVNTYDELRTLCKKSNPNNELDNDFDSKVIDVANKLKKTLDDGESSGPKNIHVLKARHSVLDIIFDKITKEERSETTSNLWNTIRKEYNEIIQGLLDIIENTKDIENKKQKHDEAFNNIKERLEDEINKNKELNMKFEIEKRKLLGEIMLLRSKPLNTISKNSETFNVPQIKCNQNEKDLKSAPVNFALIIRINQHQAKLYQKFRPEHLP